MSLPKKEVAVWLSAERHAKLKALAEVRGVPMGKWIEVYVGREIDLQYMAAVSVVEAVAATGLATGRHGAAREVQDFQETDFSNGVGL